MTKALIVVDFENEWIDKKSEYYIGNIDSEIKKTNQLIDYCRAKKYKIIFIRHVEKGSANAFSDNSKNTNIINALHKKDGDTVITKYKISSFFKTELEKELKNQNEIVVCGILTNLCVRQLIEEAYDREFAITAIKDCCVAFDKQTQEFTFKDLKSTREEVVFLKQKKFCK